MSNLKLVKDNDSQFRFQLKSKDKKKKYAELVLYGTIGEDWWTGEGITAKSVQKEMKAFGEIDKLDVRLNSPGGDVFDGVTIHNLIKRIDDVTIFVDGLAASIASIIAMAGDKIVFSDGALMMIHSPMTGVFGNQRDMEERIQVLDTIEEEMLGIYSRKTGMDRAELRTMVHAESWFGAEEALEMGFATEIDQELQVAACSDFTAKIMAKKYKNCPDNLLTRSKEVKKDISNKLKVMEDYLAR